MPIRGLRDTEPYHWDGIPGDPYGGVNAANTDGYVPRTATLTTRLHQLWILLMVASPVPCTG